MDRARAALAELGWGDAEGKVHLFVERVKSDAEMRHLLRRLRMLGGKFGYKVPATFEPWMTVLRRGPRFVVSRYAEVQRTNYVYDLSLWCLTPDEAAAAVKVVCDFLGN